MPKPIRKSIRSKIILIGLALLGFILVLFREQWLLFIGDFLVIKDTLHPADVIHVIAGEDYRTDYAIQLYKQGYGKTLFFTGGWCTFHDYYHGVHAKERSLAQGVPSEAIAFDDSKVTSTYSEAEKLKDWITHNPNPIRSVIVVSDPFHMRRVRWTYSKVLGHQVQVYLAPIPYEKTPYQQKWWKDASSRIYVRDEYLKLSYYFLRYQYPTSNWSSWMATFDRD
jgi:uncharacterized SAM-binding protein YcdF (DUF218 family)